MTKYHHTRPIHIYSHNLVAARKNCINGLAPSEAEAHSAIARQSTITSQHEVTNATQITLRKDVGKGNKKKKKQSAQRKEGR